MSFKSISDLETAFGFSSPSSSIVGLKDILTELQGLRISKVGTVAQTTNASLVGEAGATGSSQKITTSDHIVAVLQIGVATGGLTVNTITLRNDYLVASTGNIQFTGAAMQGHALVFWFDKTGFVA